MAYQLAAIILILHWLCFESVSKMGTYTHTNIYLNRVSNDLQPDWYRLFISFLIIMNWFLVAEHPYVNIMGYLSVLVYIITNINFLSIDYYTTNKEKAYIFSPSVVWILSGYMTYLYTQKIVGFLMAALQLLLMRESLRTYPYF